MNQVESYILCGLSMMLYQKSAVKMRNEVSSFFFGKVSFAQNSKYQCFCQNPMQHIFIYYIFDGPHSSFSPQIISKQNSGFWFTVYNCLPLNILLLLLRKHTQHNKVTTSKKAILTKPWLLVLAHSMELTQQRPTMVRIDDFFKVFFLLRQI